MPKRPTPSANVAYLHPAGASCHELERRHFILEGIVDLEVHAPAERIERAVQELTTRVRSALLETLATVHPTVFEHIVLELLQKMGYGRSAGDIEHSGGTGDCGIDGVIAYDPLGLEKIYMQAKRWKNSVGRPEIQGFYGALAGKRARKGVFMTTSHFTREALSFAQSVSDAIVLVDGFQLAELMISHEVGVVQKKMVSIPVFDATYFDRKHTQLEVTRTGS